jgi:hypothetical protein
VAGAGTTAASSTAKTAAASGAPSRAPQDLRDVRYCEVIPSIANGSGVTTYVDTTLNDNPCPPKMWDALTEDQVNQEYGSQSADLNGPRLWLLDEAQGSGSRETGKTFPFGGIEMGLRATLQTKAGEPTVGFQFSVPNPVKGDSIWTDKAGKQLPSPGTKLKLPSGWKYSSMTISKDLSLNSNGPAYVVNHDLDDSYRRR